MKQDKRLIHTILALALSASILIGCATGYDINKATPYARVSASTVTSGFLIASKDAPRDAAIARSVAGRLQALSTGPVVSPEQFRTTLLTVVPKDSKYIALVASLTGLYAQVQPNIKTDYSAYLKFLNELSNGVLDATAGYP